uniref:Methyltransferase-like 26 n=1 Tax=Caenorhabditis japonica TaxID=281687 RepID=A0A8R1DXR8_CAEJA
MLRAPAADSNKDVILEVLKRFVAVGTKVFEIASGTGQHVAHFARALPNVTFQPTECNGRYLHSIVAHLDHYQLENVRIPLFIDVSKRFDQWALPGDFGPHMVDVILNINMIHICSPAAIEGLFESADQLLNETTGVLLTYGPYSVDGFITPQSNVAFHAQLRAQDPEHGLKDVKYLERIANRSNLRLSERIAVPQNNFILVFSR